MIFYILLTHGPKPTGNIRNHPAARTQLALFDRIIEQYPKIKHQFVCDYARRIEGLAALPDLRRHLVMLKEMGDGEIIADSLSRLVRKVAFDQRAKFISELGEYGRHLFLLSHKKKLSNFSQSEITGMIFHAEKLGSPAKQRRNRDTKNARAASLESRQRLRDRIRHRLEELQGELRDTQGRGTLQMVADCSATTTLAGSDNHLGRWGLTEDGHARLECSSTGRIGFRVRFWSLRVGKPGFSAFKRRIRVDLQTHHRPASENLYVRSSEPQPTNRGRPRRVQ